jgi:hypothetical protein
MSDINWILARAVQFDTDTDNNNVSIKGTLHDVLHTDAIDSQAG